MDQIVKYAFVIFFTIVFCLLTAFIVKLANDDIDNLFIWNRNVLRVGCFIALIVWIVKAIKTRNIFDVDYSLLVLGQNAIFWLANFIICKVFHKNFSRYQRRRYLSDPTIILNRFPLFATFVIIGTPISVISDIWYLISSFFL